MSYHEIEIVQSYLLKCRKCEYEGWARTAGLAEQQATEHIEVESREGGMPNYEHVVAITPVTLVGRQI